MPVSCSCCMLSGSLCVGLITVRRSPTECGVSECDREASIMRRPWPTRGCFATGGKTCKWFYRAVKICLGNKKL
jgi:hypothetical protein